MREVWGGTGDEGDATKGEGRFPGTALQEMPEARKGSEKLLPMQSGMAPMSHPQDRPASPPGKESGNKSITNHRAPDDPKGRQEGEAAKSK